ncbi:MAG: hypothetical protein QM681_18290 [Novosphingobium sp.]
MSGWIDKARRKVAGWVLGNRTAIYIPNEYRGLREGGYFERLPDHELAQLARYFFYVARNVNREMADERKVPASVFTMSQSVMSVIRCAIEANAETATFTQRGEINGEQIGVWQVTAKKLPDDYDFAPLGVEETYADDDPERLTSLSLSYVLPLPSREPTP